MIGVMEPLGSGHFGVSDWPQMWYISPPFAWPKGCFRGYAPESQTVRTVSGFLSK